MIVRITSTWFTFQMFWSFYFDDILTDWIIQYQLIYFIFSPAELIISGWILLIVIILVKKSNQEQASGANLKLPGSVDCRLEMATGDKTVPTNDMFQRPATENNAILVL